MTARRGAGPHKKPAETPNPNIPEAMPTETETAKAVEKSKAAPAAAGKKPARRAAKPLKKAPSAKATPAAARASAASAQTSGTEDKQSADASPVTAPMPPAPRPEPEPEPQNQPQPAAARSAAQTHTAVAAAKTSAAGTKHDSSEPPAPAETRENVKGRVDMEHTADLKILFVASEATPFIATGGLADVAGSLPAALRSAGADCRAVLPLYSDIPQELRSRMTYRFSFTVPLSWRRQYCGVFEYEQNGTVYYFLDNEYYFKRRGIYGHYDDAERFAFFSRAALEMLRYLDFRPNVLHANDWHTALVPVFYRAFYADDEQFRGMRTVFTIHNIQFQGKYGIDLVEDLFGLPGWIVPAVEYDGCVNLMKGAIETADAVTTVSPTYAGELRYPYYAYELERIIARDSGKISGILNGIDTAFYNPQTDEAVFRRYGPGDFAGKAENKRALQELLGLPADEDALMVGVVSRLTAQKGVELIKFVLPEMMTDHIQLVILGTGDFLYENYFREMRGRYPGKMAVTVGFIPDLARKIYAGADALLMPSKTEPCGLSQMVALRYGTIPIVRETGGLRDSVQDAGSGPEPSGNGYTFKSFNAHDMLGALRRAEGAFVQKPYWQALISRAMASDFSWKRSAGEYLALYQRLSPHE